MASVSEKADQFGFALAVGDFNGDGYSDLAVGAPGETLGSSAGAGAVNVLYGSASGLTSSGNQMWTQDAPGVPGSVKPGSGFGRAVAAGDFNGDGFSDLAIGLPGMTVNSKPGAGGIIIVYGGASGLSSAGSRRFNQNTLGLSGAPATGDAMGRALVAGDFGAGTQQDLAIGNPFDDPFDVADAGSVAILYGSAAGLTATGGQLLTQNSPGIIGTSEPHDLFGFDLAAGTFDGGARDALAIGVPNETRAGVDAGAVNVIYSNGSSLAATGNQVVTENSTGGTGEDGDGFGNALAAANFGGGVEADLAVAAAGDKVGAVVGAGSVTVVETARPAAFRHRARSGISTLPGSSGRLVRTTSSAPTHGRPTSTTAARPIWWWGATFKDIAGNVDAGSASVIYGSVTGLTSTGNQFWSQNSPGVIGNAEAGDEFAFSVI